MTPNQDDMVLPLEICPSPPSPVLAAIAVILFGVPGAMCCYFLAAYFGTYSLTTVSSGLVVLVVLRLMYLFFASPPNWKLLIQKDGIQRSSWLSWRFEWPAVKKWIFVQGNAVTPGYFLILVFTENRKYSFTSSELVLSQLMLISLVFQNYCGSPTPFEHLPLLERLGVYALLGRHIQDVRC